SKEISDQYAAVIITLKNGKEVTGRVVNSNGDNMSVMTNMLDPNGLANVSAKQVESVVKSKVSMMPKGLVDTFKEDEILDLVAYLLSRGDRNHKMFQPAARAGEAKPGAAPAGFDARRGDAERGKVEAVEYDSKAVGAKRKAVVYTPPGYTKDRKYPVFYLLHGGGDDETGWQKKGSADVILDNLHADGKVVPMVVVMPNGFARPAGGQARDNRFQAFEDDL